MSRQASEVCGHREEEVREIPDGYAFRLPSAAEWVRQAADFITKERLCCPFFGFTLRLEPEQGALWLSLTGREGDARVRRNS